MDSVSLFLDVRTTALSNFISSVTTLVDPLRAAMWAQVLPSLVAAETKECLASKSNSMTSACNVQEKGTNGQTVR